VHPVAWWVWALGLLVAANATTNPVVLALVLAVLALVVTARRPAAAWGDAFRVSLRLGMIVIASRVLLQVIFNPPVGYHVAATLPAVHLPAWLAGIRLGGLVTWETILVGLTEGLRLATMIACVGAANSLAAPSRLLRSVPAALYELGVAVVVALSASPNLLADAHRVRAARRLRGFSEGRIRSFAAAAGPVLEGGLDRSLDLAAAMDSRGYGRLGPVTARQRRTHVGLALLACAGVLVGGYALLDTAAPRLLGWPLLAVSAIVAVLALRSGGARSSRTSYRPDPWSLPEWVTAGSGLIVALVGLSLTAPPAVGGATTLSGLLLPALPLGLVVALLLACLPAWLTPPPPGTPIRSGSNR
jgi:energy-coupling factor transport system permease protein